MRQWTLLFVLVAVLEITGCGMAKPCPASPSITGQPTNQVVMAAQPALFTVAASGSAPLTYQWKRNGTAIVGATQPSYMTQGTTAADSGLSFSVTITNALGSLTSLPATLAVVSAVAGKERFVAPNGNDANAGTIDQPYRTIQQCATTVTEGWTCEVRAGTYRETVSPNSGVTISSYHLEPVTVDGSDPISGWALYRKGIYKTSVTLNPDDTNQIFVGNNMMTEARWPNGDDLFYVNWAKAQRGTNKSQIVDSNLPQVDWKGAKVHLWSGIDPFGHQTALVTDSDSGRLAIDLDEVGTCPYICPAQSGFYYLYGSLNALDVEREWFYDSATRILYFMPPGAVNPNTLDVRAKRRQYAFDLRGKNGVRIESLAVFASTIVTDENSSNNTLDHINAQYVSHFTDLPTASDDPGGGKFSIIQVHTKDTGIVLYGTGNVIQNSTIAYSAGDGIALEGGNNTVINNLIHHIDYIGNYSSGINLDADGNTIQHNTIHDVGRQAILANSVVNEDIGNNNLFNAMKLSRDGGEIYGCCNQAASGTRIHHNWIHDTASLVSGHGDLLPLAGIYVDAGGSGFHIDQNVFWNNRASNLFINGADNGFPSLYSNDIHNNSIPDRSQGGAIKIAYVFDCTRTHVIDNRIVVPIEQSNNQTGCDISNNSPSAPGATEMTLSTAVGCNFEGCSSDGPAAITDPGSVTACPVSVFAQP
jgi:hypothetical protein